MARVVTCGCACHRAPEAVDVRQAAYAAQRKAQTLPMLSAFEAQMARLDAEREVAAVAYQQDRQIAEDAA